MSDRSAIEWTPVRIAQDQTWCCHPPHEHGGLSLQCCGVHHRKKSAAEKHARQLTRKSLIEADLRVREWPR